MEQLYWEDVQTSTVSHMYCSGPSIPTAQADALQTLLINKRKMHINGVKVMHLLFQFFFPLTKPSWSRASGEPVRSQKHHCIQYLIQSDLS